MGCWNLLFTDEGVYPKGKVAGQTLVTYNSSTDVVARLEEFFGSSNSGLDIADAGYKMVTSRYSKECDLLEVWKAEYDHVIIDSEPSLLISDAVLFAQCVDMVLLTSRLGVTPRTGLKRACELLHTGEARISGIIVNDMRSGDHYYGFGYISGRGYYSEEET